MAATIPDKMRALVLGAYHESVVDAINSLKVRDWPTPQPGPGQVLVKIAAAPCNPSDLLLLQGKYGELKALPTVPGWEAAGTVVASGGGLLARWLRGKRVACALRADRSGTWAEYFLADADNCIPIKSRLSFDQAAGLIINPLTATGLLETARRGGHPAAVQTAAASQLGRILLAMANEANYPLIHVVRRDAQVGLLKSLGAEFVLNSSGDGFTDELKTLCERLRATAAFEAVAGEMTGSLHHAMPRGSTIYVYGALSEEPCGNIDPVQLIFHNKTVTGFYLGAWLRKRGTLGVLRAASRMQRMFIDGRIATSIQRRLSLEDAVDGLQHYVQHMTDGKVLIVPHGK
jgi:NADPH:quinone reductase-like Zn-dependent oxidoreductase